ncbi:hypothetical protein [Neisseria sp.]
MTVNYDNLPHGKIKEYITKTFPNEPEKEALSKMIYAQLSGDKSADNIRKTVSQMGMTCEVEKGICEYSGYIKTKVAGISSGSGRAKRIYHIVIFPKKGMDSLKIEYQIVEDTEKVN